MDKLSEVSLECMRSSARIYGDLPYTTGLNISAKDLKLLLARMDKAEAELATLRAATVPVGYAFETDVKLMLKGQMISKMLTVREYQVDGAIPLFTHPVPPFDKKASVEAAHALSDVRRFIEAKFMAVADLPSEESLLLKAPECKHEADAIITALNQVADFYENAPPPVVVLEDCSIEAVSHIAHWYSDKQCEAWVAGCDWVIKKMREVGIQVKTTDSEEE